MKKLLLMILMVMPLLSYAQKKYLTVTTINGINNYSSYANRGVAYMGGDIPSGMNNYVTYEDVNTPIVEGSYTTQVAFGLLLNILSEKGYIIENSFAAGNDIQVILYKSSSDSSSAIKSVRYDDEEEVTEVARYNLQGQPIGKEEKGLQVIVYSNYTTKTVIVE